MTAPSAPAYASAAELLRQHAARETFRALAGALAPADTPAAYRIQDSYVAQLREQRQATLAGYKIAITTPAMRDMVGFQDSVSGRLLADQLYRSGHSLNSRDYVRLIVEFEIAFELARDLPVRANAWTGATILEHVKFAYPALEIADDRQADYASLNRSVLTLIADNAWNQGLVLGDPVAGMDADGIQALQGVAMIDGREVGRGSGRDVLGHPLDALAWLANHLAARGLPLHGGDIVTTGSLVKSQFPVAGNRVAFSLPGLGEVHLAVD
ncbi:2-keto-4-pentenoate hydratase [Caenimonas terrae]|uniref:2-keto-4-pentenoate hydratase n=1 Tax=Caenimonas terrae TaxID=696074 RepID=A0ABW0NAT6_9BURK